MFPRLSFPIRQVIRHGTIYTQQIVSVRDRIVSSFDKLIGSANPIFWIVIHSLQLDKIYYTHMDKIKNKRIIFYNIIIKI